VIATKGSGTVTYTKSGPGEGVSARYESLVFEITANASGEVELTLEESDLEVNSEGRLNRKVTMAWLEPGSGTVPTDGYSVYLETAAGAVGVGRDLLGGAGVSAGSNTERVPLLSAAGYLGCAVNDTVTLKGTGLGNGGTSTVTIVLEA